MEDETGLEFAKKHLAKSRKAYVEKYGELIYMGIAISKFEKEDLEGMVYELQHRLKLKSETLEEIISMELNFLHHA